MNTPTLYGIGSRATYSHIDKDLEVARTLFEYSILIVIILLAVWGLSDYIKRGRR